MVETTSHKRVKHKYAKQLKKNGYTVEMEKSLVNSVTSEKMIADIYAEDETSIIVIEVINRNWTKHDPKDFISTTKDVRLILAHTEDISPEILTQFQTNRKRKQGPIGINFQNDVALFIDLNTEKGERSQFVNEQMRIAMNCKIDLSLLKTFIGAFNEYRETGAIPKLNITEEEMARYTELVKEIETQHHKDKIKEIESSA